MRIQQLRLPNRRLVIFAFSASLVLAAGLLALAQGHHMRRHTRT